MTAAELRRRAVATAEAAGPTAPRPWALLARRAALGPAAAVLLIVAVGAAAAPWISPADPAQVDFGNRFAAPSIEHPLGTDNLGRDELSRLLHGAGLSLSMALSATAGIALVGTAAGLLAGMSGRVTDSLVSRVVEVLQALPTLILALVVVGLLGTGTGNLVLAIVLVGWTGHARVVRAMALAVRERPYIEAARGLGAAHRRIVLRHVVPNLLGPVVVLTTLDLGRILLVVSGLSFLGLGIEPPTPEWGAMLAESRSYLDRAPQLLLNPGLAITVVVLACNLAGDALRDALDPFPTHSLFRPRWTRFR